MSVVIIGGHDRMVCQYKKICRQFNCKAKVFTQMSASWENRSEVRIWSCFLQIRSPTRW